MGYSFNQLREILHKLGYKRRQGAKHEVWVKAEANKIRRVVLSRKGSEEIGPHLMSRILRQMGMTREEFERVVLG